MDNAQDLPTYYVDIEDGLAVFRCSACGKTHRHSPPARVGREHRATHCEKQPAGYYIEQK